MAEIFDDSGAWSPVARRKRTPSKRYSPDALPIQIQPSGVWAMPVMPVGAPSLAVQLPCTRSISGA